ncbi:enoyl-CoA hydratase/isomerase family protein [Candidatus Aalborgicola defluviihabitans]|uniref:enoyl-CoA hydratase/isomerase family protein n=1 Tax=Candidatus Aalborgicola defluviihabitans TaxID=3386187 RepID=UPI001EBDFB55|nr:enoyl-CoA hydratase/isomerase family protein [Burkholderiales bacterium]
MNSTTLSLETVEARLEAGIVYVTLNRPDKRNAVNAQLLRDLVQATQELAYRPEARVLLLSGAGPSFCAGYDVSQTANADTRSQWIASEEMAKAFAQIEAAPVVRIAQVHGHAVGAGLGLAMLCELRYATPDAVFAVPELDFGIPFSMGGMNSLTRYIGVTRTADMVLNARRMSGAQALSYGLVTEVVALDELSAQVQAIAQKLARRPSVLLMTTQVSLREAALAHTPEGKNDLAAMFLCRQDPDCQQVSAQYTQQFRPKK